MDRGFLWLHDVGMAKTVEISSSVERLREKIAVAAAESGLSLEEYVLRDLEQATAPLANEELFARLLSLPPIDTRLDAAEIIRELRGPLPDDVKDRR
jgi:hypothetical protein